MREIDDIPWWVWSIIWFVFGNLLLVSGAYIIATQEAVRNYGALLLLPGISALAVGLLVAVAPMTYDEIEPLHQVAIWIGICVAIAFIPYLMTEIMP